MKKAKLTYTFHNPNPAGVTAEFLLKVFVEVNLPKVQVAVYRSVTR